MLDGVQLDVELPDLLRAGPVGGLNRRGLEALPFRFRDLVARGVLQALEPLDLLDQAPSRRVERGNLVEGPVGIHPAPAKTTPDFVDVIPHRHWIEHATSASILQPRPPDRFAPPQRPLLRYADGLDRSQ